MSDNDMACERHGLEELPNGYDECPQCAEERRMEACERERMERRADPQMHNMVDAQANAIDHSRSPSDFM